MSIDVKEWGTNILATNAKVRDGCVIIRYRGWKPFAVLVVLMVISIFMAVNTPATFVLTYIIIPALGIGALLSLLYIQELVFDYNSRKIHSRHGYYWNHKLVEIPFDDVDTLLVKTRGAMGVKSPNMMKTTATHMGWDVILVSRSLLSSPGILNKPIGSFSPGLSKSLELSFPGINFWRSPTQQKAFKVANSLAKDIGCNVKEE